MKMKCHRGRLSVGTIEANATIPVVSNAAIATSAIGEGRFIPLVIIDTSNHKHIEDLVNVHEKLPPGDVEIRWGWPQNSKETISLILDFKKPIITKILLDFDIMLNGGLVDLIINSKALYLQPGRQGDRLGATMDNPRILVEIPDTGFDGTWLDKWKKTTFKKMRNQGLSRAEAKKASQALIDGWRKTLSLRMK